MWKSFNELRYSSSNLIGLLIWILTCLSLPILGWIMGDDYLLRGISMSVLFQAIAVLMIINHSLGLQRTFSLFATVTGISFLAEWLGVNTGFPFGKYTYTAILQPQLAGVPLIIPLAWWMMLPPAWGIAYFITGQVGAGFKPAPTISFVIVSALAFTAWDLFLDPQMVAWDFWRWQSAGQYFGIPLSNFLGWLVISALLSFIANPVNIPAGPLSLVYGLTWILQTLGQGIFWQQPGPALVGFTVTGIFVLLAFFSATPPKTWEWITNNKSH